MAKTARRVKQLTQCIWNRPFSRVVAFQYHYLWDAPAWTMLVPQMNGPLQDGQRTAFWDSYNHGYKNRLPCSAQP